MGRGRTIRPTEAEEWTRTYYEVEMDISELPNSEEITRAKNLTEKMIDEWLQKPFPPEAVSALGIPKIDIAELDECGWQTFQKEPAPPGKTAWIKNPVAFTSWQDPPAVLIELVKAMGRTKERKLVLGDCEYSFSGKEEEFINRKSVKTESAR